MKLSLSILLVSALLAQTSTGPGKTPVVVGATYSGDEIPKVAAPGTWTLQHTPVLQLQCFRNGLRQSPFLNDFTITGSTITSTTWGSDPSSPDGLICTYFY